jgi:hypothetical protein
MVHAEAAGAICQSIHLPVNNFPHFPDPSSWENELPVLSRRPARGTARGPWVDDATAPAGPENRLAATFYGRLSGGLKNIWNLPM